MKLINPALSAASTSSRSNVGTKTSDPMNPAAMTYFENVDKSDFQRYQKAKERETSSSISRSSLGGPSSRSNNEERITPSISRSQENAVPTRGNSKISESETKRNVGLAQWGPGMRSILEHSCILAERHSLPEHQARQAPPMARSSAFTPETWEAKKKSLEESMQRAQKMMQKLQARTQKTEFPAELESTPITKLPHKGKLNKAVAPSTYPPQELEQKPLPAKQPAQVLPEKSTGPENDPYFNPRAEFHLQEWLNESDKGDLVTATEHLAVVENMIVEKWGSIKAAPKRYISTFLTCKIMNLIRYNQDQEALQLVKYIEPVYQDQTKREYSGSHLVAEIVLYMRLKEWDKAKMKCARFLQPEFLEDLGPKAHPADQSLGFWLMSKILKDSGKPVEAKFYKAQVKPGLSAHSWYKWADQCLRQR
ncbi:uncharacterized protein DFL_000388 [Arthrobotrys flagrans]|uniref:Uncharacterized protein n=1 Tax=Arthrobotrys flagrans TaxID=97331 RepID=A0A437ADZ5_ARTFL|nr:hypothetical protein DFL_000388 [Arthrobotrys flagrans]